MDQPVFLLCTDYLFRWNNTSSCCVLIICLEGPTRVLDVKVVKAVQLGEYSVTNSLYDLEFVYRAGWKI